MRSWLLSRPVPLILVLCCALVQLMPRALAVEPTPNIKLWVSQLNDDVYDIREKAVTQLIGAGVESIAPVEAEIEKANLEVVVRGLNVLAALAVKSETVATRDAAFDAMVRLTRSPSALIAGHAESFLSVIRGARQREAIAWLEERGAEIDAANQTAEFGPAWTGTANDLQRMAYLYDIHEVTLLGPQVNDAWLVQVARLPELRELTLKKGKITSAGLRHLSGVKSLRNLYVLYIPLDAATIGLLTEMKHLTSVKLYGTGVNLETAKKLTLLLPSTRFDVRPGGGFLGIGVQPHVVGVIISNVQPQSAAQKAGISIGDIMLSFGGEKIANFEQLQVAIGKFAPGEEVEVELLRTDKPEKVKIMLGEWESILAR